METGTYYSPLNNTHSFSRGRHNVLHIGKKPAARILLIYVFSSHFARVIFVVVGFVVAVVVAHYYIPDGRLTVNVKSSEVVHMYVTGVSRFGNR